MNANYLVIGNGRLAKHLCHYLSLLKLPYRQWYRQQAILLPDSVQVVTHILLAISDDAIEPFIVEKIKPLNLNATLVHFSGCHLSSKAHTAHPLQTFSDDLYKDDVYQKIPFFVEQEGPDFSALLPGFANPHYTLPRGKKAYYHALCVMANNFTTLLWQKFKKEMAGQFAVDEKDIKPFLKQSFLNLNHNIDLALTGPIARNDKVTLQNNLRSLRDDNFYFVYKAFCEAKGLKL